MSRVARTFESRPFSPTASSNLLSGSAAAFTWYKQQGRGMLQTAGEGHVTNSRGGACYKQQVRGMLKGTKRQHTGQMSQDIQN